MTYIERVARAIYGQRLRDLGLYEGEPAEAALAEGRNWHFTSTEARAAIAAMRVPTIEMEIAGAEQWALMSAMEDRSAANWKAMIDAALAGA